MRTNVLYAQFDVIYNKYKIQLGENLRSECPRPFSDEDIDKWYVQ